MLAQRLGLSAAELEEERRVRQEQMEHIAQLLRAQEERERAQVSAPPNAAGQRQTPRQGHAKEKQAGEGDGTEGEGAKGVGVGMVGGADGNESGDGPVEENESESGGAEAGAIDQVTEQLRLYGI